MEINKESNLDRKNFLISLCGIVFLLIFSCKENQNHRENNSGLKKIEDNKEIEYKKDDNKEIEYTIEFPDTVYVDRNYNGTIHFKSVLDKYNTKFAEEGNYRYVFFTMRITKNIDYDFQHLENVVKDTFGAIDNRTIPFYDLKFDEPGVYYIDGILKDLIMIDLPDKDEDGNEKTRIIEYEGRITHRVIVIYETDR